MTVGAQLVHYLDMGGSPAKPIVHPPILIEGGGTILYGPPGEGKSYTALTIAVAVDAGVPAGPLVPQRSANTLYVNLERYWRSIAGRLYAVNCALGLPPDRPLLALNARGSTLYDLVPVIEAAIREHRVSLLVLDSLTRAGMGFLKAVDILNAFGVTWLAVAHTPMLGSAADIWIQAITQVAGSRLGVGLKVTKANDIAVTALPIICYEFARGGTLTTIRAARPREFVDIDKEHPLRLPERLLELLTDQGPMSAEEAAAALGCSRSYAAGMLGLLEQRGHLVSYRSGRKTMYGVRLADDPREAR